jgi:hypothetical protein
VTAEERAARWGHHSGVLELTGPIYLIDLIERSLFVLGAITARIEVDSAFGVDAGMAKVLIASKALSGMIALIVNLSEGETLIARAEGEQITLDAKDVSGSIAAVHELLGRANILVPRENADWVI